MNWRFTLRLLKRDCRSFDVQLVGVAIMIAVAATSAVNYFTDRVQLALVTQANELLGADLLIRSSRAITSPTLDLVHELGLTQTQSLSFPSMLLVGERSQLVSVKSVKPGFPLRGQIRLSEFEFSKDHAVTGIPPSGELWVEARALSLLKIKLGARVSLGNHQFTVTGVITHEPGRGNNFFGMAPRVMLNDIDLANTQLLQVGSRVQHQLLLAGTVQQLGQFSKRYLALKNPHERLLTTEQARPEIRNAMQRARQFLSLASLTTVLLAVLAIIVSVQSYVKRQIKQIAVLRSLGATQNFISLHYTISWLCFGAMVALLGCVLGYFTQHIITAALTSGYELHLPAPSPWSWLFAWGLGMLSIMGFVLPPVWSLRDVSTLSLLQQQQPALSGRYLLRYGLGIVAILLLIFLHTEQLKLAAYVIGTTMIAFCGLGLLAYVSLKFLARLGKSMRGAWRFGLIHPARRLGPSILQMIALASAVMAILLLNIVRDDLLQDWQQSLPEHTPNRFLINIQEDQLQALSQYFEQATLPVPEFYPMIRGRLHAINDKLMLPQQYEGRSKFLLQREFNLSWADTLPKHNRLIQGEWWVNPVEEQAFSIEKNIAARFGIQVGDKLVFDIAGNKVKAKVQNIRQVEWDSFKINFFVLSTAELMQEKPVSYVTSFFVDERANDFLAGLVQQFPNITLIDVASIMEHVRKIISRVSQAVGLIFLLTVVASLLVIMVTLHSSREQRYLELTLLRVFGASDRQLRQAWYTEWISIGLGAGICASVATSIIAAVVAYAVLHFQFVPSAGIVVMGLSISMSIVMLVAWFGGRPLLRRSVLGGLAKF